MKSGLDTNGNSTLEDSEATSTAYTCNGPPGGAAARALVKLDPEPSGTHCAQGGTRVNSGLDANDNGTLDPAEVTSTSYVCNGTSGSSGTPGAQTLVRSAPEPAGSNCAHGGTAVQSGLDANHDGALDTAEVASTAYVCNGAAGTPGAPGAQALVRLDPEPPGANCAQGGTVVRSGLDTNGNGTLEASEVAQTRYVCSNQALYPTGWAASAPSYSSGDLPPSLWHSSGRKVSILKLSAASRLKITVSDNLGVGIGVIDGSGYYAIRMNGGYMSPNCHQRQRIWNARDWSNTYYFPFATVCLTDVLPAGLYEFETWAYSHAGAAHVGAGLSQPLVFVEELLPTTRYGASTTGGESATSSSTYQKASGRTVNYTKQDANTLLKVTLADTFRSAYNQNGGWGTIMIRMDGNNTSCFTGQHDAQGTGGNFHHPIVMTCVLPAVATGAHTFDVWIRSDTGRDTHLGWERSYPLLMVEEVENQKLTYSNSSSESEELSGDWEGVETRQVQHTVSAAGKAVRVTYSDTFRGTFNCGAQWGYYQLYVDGQPTYCYNGQYSYNSGSTAHDHHHPVNQTCLVKGLTAGPHTFAIWSTTRHWDGTACGTNRFGWNRGQNLLLVEELP
ncbi:MAG TPA: hypothetical protein VD972_12125 [Hyalangium sp.]|nr:hypothetical protein [Hyalangium sp.]HYH96714.1 hypothetical protein [Hyalangium sp.]